MKEHDKPKTGTIVAADLTVPNAPELRDFYAAVTGWTTEEVPMGDYADYMMKAPETGQPVAGVCHARGGNKDLPPQWIIYVSVSDVAAALAKVAEMGGTVIVQKEGYAIFRDPAGATMGLVKG